jgi:hypothetical protein
MDADLYREAIEYELLARAIYQAIHEKEGINTVKVQHNVSLAGRSGVEHQVDVYWEFKQASVTHRVLVECKNYGSNLTLEKARNFFAVVHDVGNCVGIMVTKTGYQSGAAAFCKHYGISLKLLRQPTDKDWEGRFKTVRINLIPRVPVSNEQHPIVCTLVLRPDSLEQQARLKGSGPVTAGLIRATPHLRFLGKDGGPITEELMWWLPRQLDVLGYKDGGPYEKSIELTEHYVPANLGSGPELIQVIGVVIQFYVQTLESTEIIVNAAETVSMILKDFDSGAWEHVHPPCHSRNSGRGCQERQCHRLCPQ